MDNTLQNSNPNPHEKRVGEIFNKACGILTRYHEVIDKEVRVLFDLYDIDHDGKISIFDMRDRLAQLGEFPCYEGLKKMMSLMDKDGDGYVDFEELREYYMHHMRPDIHKLCCRTQQKEAVPEILLRDRAPEHCLLRYRRQSQH